MNVLLSPSDASWVAVALDAVWKSLILLISAGIIVMALRRSSAATRHLVWGLAMAGTLVLPLLRVAIPSWSLAILPAASVATKDASGTVSPHAFIFDGPSGQRSLYEEADDMARPDRDLVTHSASVAATDTPPIKVTKAWPLPAWALGIWLAGAAIVLGGPLLGRLFLLGQVRGAVPIDQGEWAELARTESQQLGLKRPVKLLRSDHLLMPMTWGWFRPVVLVPAHADDWPHARRRDVLLHELAHVRRFDCLTQSIAQLACSAYWFNPLAWLAARRMRIERERACDDIVLLAGSPASDYAAHLLAIARELKRDRLTALTAVAMAQPGSLEGRLVAILDRKRCRASVGYRSAALVTAALFSGLIPLAAVRLAAHSTTAIQAPTSQVGGDRKADEPPGPRMIVTGQVVDQEGAPVANAAVTVFTQPKLFERPMLVLMFENPLIIGEARSDGSGRFRIDAARTSSSTHDLLRITALAPGHGLGWVDLGPDAAEATAKISLPPEFVIDGRLFDVQGQPARGVKVSIVWMLRSGEMEGMGFVSDSPQPLSSWPAPAMTDANGHFTVRNVGRELRVLLAVDDPRFASLRTTVATGESVDPNPFGIFRSIIKLEAKPGASKLTLALEPAQIITGRVTYADTGNPVPHAPLSVSSTSDTQSGGRSSRFTADSEGRFRINPSSGDHFRVATQSPDGQPYLAVTKTVDWPKGAIEQTVEFALPQGRVVRGKVSEGGSGKPIVGAVVRFTPHTVPRTSSSTMGVPSLTRADGSFSIAGVPDQGYVVVQGPSDDYVLKELAASGGAFYAQPGNRRFYAHAYKFIDLRPEASSQTVNLTLEHGLTVKGRLIGPDDRPVKEASMLSRGIMRSTPAGGWKIPGFNAGARVLGGSFQIHGLGPQAKTPVYFLDSEHELGATIQLSGEAAGNEPLTVRLERCGTAKARLVDSSAKPVKGQSVPISLIVTPGINLGARDQKPKELVAIATHPAQFDPKHYGAHPASDAQGQIFFPALIPGATYRFTVGGMNRRPGGPPIQKEVNVKPGEAIDLGDILIERPTRVE
jgi:beta-lactamase regulating signal transducer with metallopeptidase domain